MAADNIALVADVSITATTIRPAVESFGVPLIMTQHSVFPEAYRVYSGLSEMRDDGFTAAHSAYRMAEDLMSQRTTVKQFVVGRKTDATAHTISINVTTAVVGDVYTLEVIALADGTQAAAGVTGGVITPTGTVDAGDTITIEYTAQVGDDDSDVATALRTMIALVPGLGSGGTLSTVNITADTAGFRPFVTTSDAAVLPVTETTADAGYDDALTALADVYNDWYLVLIDSGSPANVLAVAETVEAFDSPKFFLAQTVAATEVGPVGESDDSLGFDLAEFNYTRTALIAHDDMFDRIDAAWSGTMLPKTIGSATWAKKPLQSVTAANFSTSNITRLKDNNTNFYVSVRGVALTHEGTVAQGEFIDVIIGVDALTADIENSILTLIAGTDKVPYTPAGLVMVENAIRGSLRRFMGDNQQPGLLVAGSDVIVMPDFATINPADKAARRLMNVKFSATLSGGIHFVEVRGSVSV